MDNNDFILLSRGELMLRLVEKQSSLSTETRNNVELVAIHTGRSNSRSCDMINETSKNVELVAIHTGSNNTLSCDMINEQIYDENTVQIIDNCDAVSDLSITDCSDDERVLKEIELDDGSNLQTISKNSEGASCMNENSVECSKSVSNNDFFVENEILLDGGGNTENESSVNVTDDSQHEYTSKSRKRIRSESIWRRNVIKSKRNKGEEYSNWKGKTIPKRRLKDSCKSCRYKCPTKITEEERTKIFTEFWDLGDINRQRDYIINNVEAKPIKRSRVRKPNCSVHRNASHETDDDEEQEERRSRRKLSFYHYFSIDDRKERVCQTFFLNTLSISNQMIKTAFTKKSETTNIVTYDQRGKVQCNNKLPLLAKQSVKDHIDLFPRIESHYCRKNSKKEYLDSTLTVEKMYKLYLRYCEETHIKNPVKASMYRHIFNTSFNLSFFKPKKDRCDLCEQYKNSNEAEKQEMKSVIDKHMENKIAVREIKERAKERCEIEPTYCTGVFDLQQVLQCPRIEVSQVYYKRKLAVYNLSVFDLHKKEGHCYMWSEVTARRGSNEIASCVKNFIADKVMEGKNEFCFFSDNCGGQNLNRNMVAMYLYLAVNLKIKITHCFLEKGHTQNEGDSVHSVIERASVNIPIYVPEQWYILARTAKDYKVTEMQEFFDFSKLRNESFNRMAVTESGDKVHWQKVRMILVNHTYPTTVFIKYNFSDNDEFIKIDIAHARKKLDNLQNKVLSTLYMNELPISTQKFNDLLSMCKSKAIPNSYHRFFNSIKHISNIKD